MSIGSVTIWTSEDTLILFAILNYAPDMSSCDLAKICRKPCREVRDVLIVFQPVITCADSCQTCELSIACQTSGEGEDL